MEKKLLNRYKAFLDEMGIDISKDTLPLTNGGNSVVCNMETEWQECLGMSINEVTRIVAKELDKEVKWED
ncbi:MAG: hypothetical protein H8D94_01695 [Candidatus Pelagibacter sp.]|nr:hypothetical protein [Candidatus Pelagibacter sp.]